MSDLEVLACIAANVAILWAIFFWADPHRK